MNPLAALFCVARTASEFERENLLNDADAFLAVARTTKGSVLLTPAGRTFVEESLAIGCQIVEFDHYPKAEGMGGERIHFWMNRSSVEFLLEKIAAEKDRVVAVEKILTVY